MTYPDTAPQIVHMPDVEKHVVDGEVFLVCDRSETIHHLDPMAAVIWGQFSEPETVETIEALLCEAFPEQENSLLAKDLNTVVETLFKFELLRRV